MAKSSARRTTSKAKAPARRPVSPFMYKLIVRKHYMTLYFEAHPKAKSVTLDELKPWVKANRNTLPPCPTP